MSDKETRADWHRHHSVERLLASMEARQECRKCGAPIDPDGPDPDLCPYCFGQWEASPTEDLERWLEVKWRDVRVRGF